MSGLLNAAYFLPLIYRGWFSAPPQHWPDERPLGSGHPGLGETHWMLLAPVLFTTALALLAGLLAGSDISPLAWSQLIINRQFGL